MKLLIRIFFLIAAPLFSALSQNCDAELKINTTDENASIFFDGNFMGNGSIKIRASTGAHVVVIREPETKWSGDEIIDTIYVQQCDKEYSYSYSFNQNKLLVTNPPDANVYYKDSLIGYSPLFVASDMMGLKLMKGGYKSSLIDAEDLTANSAVTLDFIGKKNGENFFEQNLFKLMLGSLLVLGGTTAYYKLKADDLFDKYQQSGNKNYLDKTRRYDLISGIAFTAMQLNFGALVYYFLFE